MILYWNSLQLQPAIITIAMHPKRPIEKENKIFHFFLNIEYIANVINVKIGNEDKLIGTQIGTGAIILFEIRSRTLPITPNKKYCQYDLLVFFMCLNGENHQYIWWIFMVGSFINKPIRVSKPFK